MKKNYLFNIKLMLSEKKINKNKKKIHKNGGKNILSRRKNKKKYMKAGMTNGILNNENNSVSSRIFFRNWMINNIRKDLLDAIEISDYDKVKINLEKLEKKKEDGYINQVHLDKIINNNNDDYNLLINNFLASWVSDDENLGITKLLVKHGANINLICDNISILGYAIMYSMGGIKNIDFLIQNGSDTKWKNHEGLTIPFIACYNKIGDPNIIKKILNKETINIIEKGGDNLLLMAITSDCDNIAEQILTDYYDIIDINYIKNYAAIHLIAMKDKINLLQKIFLIDKLNLDIQTGEGETALILSINKLSYSTPRIVSQLIEAGANINLQDRKGKTALMIAIQKINYNMNDYTKIDILLDIINQLIDADADIKKKDNNGNSVRTYINKILDKSVKKFVENILYKPIVFINPTRKKLSLGVLNTN